MRRADEVPDPHDLDIVCSVGGDVVAEDNTRHYTYRVEEVVAYISRYLTLEPGDVISMGTAFRAGGQTRRPLHSANLARTGGPCEVTISRLGTLSNPVEHDPTDPGDWRLQAGSEPAVQSQLVCTSHSPLLFVRPRKPDYEDEVFATLAARREVVAKFDRRSSSSSARTTTPGFT